MKLKKTLSLPAIWALLARLPFAADLTSVTDLDAFNLLAPCAARAVTEGIYIHTQSCANDAEDITKLQSCACSNTASVDSIKAEISSSALYSCGSNATGDLVSATKVFDKYCTPDMSLFFSTPTKNTVLAYITEIATISRYLAPCALSGLSYAVMSLTNDKCPVAASLLAPCACSKDGVPDSVLSVLTSTVRLACDNAYDITAASNFYSQYCDMNQGTTSFTPPPGPPGDMTYYITALSQYKALNSCAQQGVGSAVFVQTNDNCAEGPQALASCVCIKSGMSRQVSSSLTESVKYSCSSTAIADVSSALAVFDFYCSAAKNKVKAFVGESISEAYATAVTGSGAGDSVPTATRGRATGDSVTPSETGSSNASNGGSGGSNSSDNKTSLTTPVIGGVVGGVAFVAIAVGIFLVMRRKSAKAKRAAAVATAPPPSQGPRQEYTGEPELEGSDCTSMSDLAKNGGNAAHTELHGWTLQELPSQQTERTELHGSPTAGYAQSPHSTVSPTQGYGYPPQQMQQQHYNHHPPGAHHGQGMGWQSGSAEVYEMNEAR